MVQKQLKPSFTCLRRWFHYHSFPPPWLKITYRPFCSKRWRVTWLLGSPKGCATKLNDNRIPLLLGIFYHGKRNEIGFFFFLKIRKSENRTLYRSVHRSAFYWRLSWVILRVSAIYKWLMTNILLHQQQCSILWTRVFWCILFYNYEKNYYE